MRNGLFLDDERKPSQVTWVKLPNDVIWKIVRSYDQFVRHITEHGLPEVISFDHDLEFDHYKFSGDFKIDYEKMERSGYHCAKWLLDYLMDRGIKELPEFYVHSMSPVGRENIRMLLLRWEMFQAEND
jgi:hypothetical protein